MVKADSLSRRPDHKKGMEDDNKDIVLLKPEFFRIQALWRGHLLIHRDEKGLLKKICKSKAQDEQVVKAIEAMKKAGVKTRNGRELLQHGMDSYIMITWYVGQARLFPFNLLNLAMPL